MFGRTILLLLLLWTQDSVKSLRLVELRVPAHGPEGGMALLGCQYDLQGDTLYSVKWYKDGHEFYRYVPKSEPPIFYFPRAGVNVEALVGKMSVTTTGPPTQIASIFGYLIFYIGLRKATNFSSLESTFKVLLNEHAKVIIVDNSIGRSSNTVVALVNLTQESSGNYSCEVNGEAPRFQTVIRHKYIKIYLLPKSGPRVVGLKDQYNLDDLVVANCSLPPSRPMADLEWIVNGNPAPSSYVSGPWYRVSAERPDAAESILQLRFFATTSDFVNGAIKLKCKATIPPLYQRETESTHYIALPFTEAKEIKDDKDIATSTSVDHSLASLLIPMFFLILM